MTQSVLTDDDGHLSHGTPAINLDDWDNKRLSNYLHLLSSSVVKSRINLPYRYCHLHYSLASYRE